MVRTRHDTSTEHAPRLAPLPHSHRSASQSLGLESALVHDIVSARLFDKPPVRIGRFTITRRLGSGGMGVVYEAFDPDLQRNVAIKLLRTDVAASEPTRARTRMLREARAMARLRHPNVVVVHEVGEHEGGVYIAMELIEGTTLRTWLQREPRSVSDRVDAYVSAGRGLAAAHDKGLVHRDFKPENVLVGDDGSICVTDFGLAQHAETMPSLPTIDPTTATTESSTSGGIAGTVLYMAPECLRGAPATPSSDQFSFCVALYEAMWGVRPFGETAGALLTAMAERTVPTPPRDRHVPRHVRRAILRGLAHDEADRFPSMDSLLHVLARPRNSRRIAWGVGIVAPLGIGLAVANGRSNERCTGLDAPLRVDWNDDTRQRIAQRYADSSRPYATKVWTRASAALDDYATHWIEQAEDACGDTEIRRSQTADMLDRRMTCLDRRRREFAALVRVLAGADDEAIDRTDAAIAKLAPVASCEDLDALSRREPLPAEPAARARIEEAMEAVAAAQAAQDTGAFETALEHARQAVALADGFRPVRAEALVRLGNAQTDTGNSEAAALSLEEAIATAAAGGLEELRASAWNDLVYVYVERGELEAAERAIRFASGEISALGDPAHERAALLRMQGELALRKGEIDAARQFIQQSNALVRESPSSSPADIAGSEMTLGNVEHAAGEYRAALQRYDAAVEGFSAALGDEHPRTLGARSNYASVLVELRRLGEALVEHREILAARKSALGDGHHLLSANLIAMAAIHYYRAELPEAIAMQEEAVDLLVRTQGPAHDETLDARENLAAMLIKIGRNSEAATMAQDVAKLRRKPDGAHDHELAGTLGVLARAEYFAGDEALAREHVYEAIEHVEGSVGEHPTLFDLLALAAEVEHTLGDHRRAVELDERALAIGERAYGSDHTMLREALLAMARCHAELGHPAQAEAANARAAAIARAHAAATP